VSASCRIVPAGDACVLLQFDERIDPKINAQAVAAAAMLERTAPSGIRDIVPAFRSVAVHFDPLHTHYEALLNALRAASSAVPQEGLDLPAPLRVPVCYGGDFGPDLPDVANFAGLSEDEVVDLHGASPYRVFMLGFMPGFAYLGPVAARIAAPRRAVPRARVAPGSVGIAGQQTGIYPAETPGGWQIIGRTPIHVFDLSRAEPCLFRAGDTVQFYPVSRRQYEELARANGVVT
jgi:inhibitor of KinA